MADVLSYRDWLTYQAKNNPGATKRAEAAALLGVVGDDKVINPSFLSGTKGGLFNLFNREQTSNGYNASTINRTINPWWSNAYNSYVKANSGGSSSTSSTGGDGGGGNTGTGYYTSGGSNYATAAQLAEYDQGINQLQHGLGRIGNQLNVRLGNIQDQYNTKNNELASSYKTAENQYKTQTKQNQQQRRSNVNTINDKASIGLRGLLRSLGSRGAVGSDLQLAGRAVQNQANAQQRAGAGRERLRAYKLFFNRLHKTLESLIYKAQEQLWLKEFCFKQ